MSDESGSIRSHSFVKDQSDQFHVADNWKLKCASATLVYILYIIWFNCYFTVSNISINDYLNNELYIRVHLKIIIIYTFDHLSSLDKRV